MSSSEEYIEKWLPVLSEEQILKSVEQGIIKVNHILKFEIYLKKYGWGIFKSAAKGDCIAIIILFVENIFDENDIHKALRYSACYGYLKTVKFLIESGADIHTNNDEVYHFAVLGEQKEVVNYLKQKMN